MRAGFQIDEALRCAAKGAVGFEPETALDGIRAVLDGDRRRGGELRAFSADDVIVIEFVGTDSNGYVERAGVGLIAGLEGTHAARDHLHLLLDNGVGEEVRRRIGLLFQCGEIAVEFLGKDVEEGRTLGEAGVSGQQAEGDHYYYRHYVVRITGVCERDGGIGDGGVGER